MAVNTMVEIQTLEGKVYRLQQENKRLRDALKEIADLPNDCGGGCGNYCCGCISMAIGAADAGLSDVGESCD